MRMGYKFESRTGKNKNGMNNSIPFFPHILIAFEITYPTIKELITIITTIGAAITGINIIENI